MNIGKLPSSLIIDNPIRSESGSDVTCVEEPDDEVDQRSQENLSDVEDNGDDGREEDEGQTFYSVASDQSSSPENSTRTQVKFLGKDSNQHSSSPTSASSLNTSSSALSSYEGSPHNPGLLYSFLFPGVVRRKSSCEKVKKRRSSSLRKVSIKDKPETFFLDQESRKMSQDSMNPELDRKDDETDLGSAGPSSKMSSRKTSSSSRKSSLGLYISTPVVSRRESADENPVRSRIDSESSIGSWRKASTTSIEEKQDTLKIKGQGRRRSETINYEADNEVRHRFVYYL